MTDINCPSQTDLEEYVAHVYNTRMGGSSTDANALNYTIKDFGDILFADNDFRSKYIRVPYIPTSDDSQAALIPSFQSSQSLNTDNTKERRTFADCVADLMRYGWKLPPPQLVISVTGGAQFFKFPTPRARHAFQRGLMTAAATTDAWIITGGTYTGVMKQVGDAVDKHRYKHTKSPSKVQCIGIGSWYFTTDHHCLVQKSSIPSNELTLDLSHPSVDEALSKKGQNSDHKDRLNNSSVAIDHQIICSETERMEIEHRNRTKVYRIRTPKSNEESCPLDLNHSHFILLDDMLGETMEASAHDLLRNVNCRADLAIKPRSEIEHAISQSFSIPIIQILANGGASSILTICCSLQSQTPVIAIEGTGRAADEVAREYRYLYGDHSTKYGAQRSIEEYQRASSTFESFATRIRSAPASGTVLNRTNRDQFIERLTSVEGYFLISTFQFDSEEGDDKFDDAILHALFNAAKLIQNEGDQRIIELKLAMAWNKFDRIERHILTDQTIIKWTDLELDRALCDAIQMDKVSFVNVLYEYGATFDRLQRLNVLDQFYQQEAHALPYSTRMIERIRDAERTFGILKPNKRYLYEDYLSIDLTDADLLSKNSIDNPTVTHGILDDANITTKSAAEISQSICVFNGVDLIQVNGFLDTISIRFDNRQPVSALTPPMAYAVSPTNQSDFFLCVDECPLELVSNDSAGLCHYRAREKQLFLVTGQHIAIVFTNETGFPCNIPFRSQYSMEQIPALNSKRPIQFKLEGIKGAAISFNINPSPEFVRDLFIWSLFFDRFNMATYFCSKCPNTVTAALIASEVYEHAAESTRNPERQLAFRKKQKKFDEHAATIIDNCFEHSEEFALKILTKQSSLFFNKSPLEIAKDINSRSFLVTKTVQRYLDHQWFGRINESNELSFSISLLIFGLCLLPILIPFQFFSKYLNSDKRQAKPWEKKPHLIGWTGTIFYRYKEFYYERAIVPFFLNIVFYLSFLTLFSYVLLVGYFPLNINGGRRSGYRNLYIPISEICVHVLIWGLIFGEINEFLHHVREQKKSRRQHIVWNYIMLDKWNLLDFIIIVVYLVGFILRFLVIEEAFIASKILMSVNLFLWYVRLLHVFAAFERLGPKLLMIFNTMKDLVFFIYFILIFFVGYTVASYSLIITKHQVVWEKMEDEKFSTHFNIMNNGSHLWDWVILGDLLNWGLWKIFGEVDLEASYHVFADNNKVSTDNDAYGTSALMLTVLYVCIANVLLLNVLISLFSISIQKVQESAYETWAYHRFLLVMEYTNKTIFPPPLNILTYIIRFIYHFSMDCLPKRTKNIYGISRGDEVLKIDSNLMNMVVFNGVDRIRQGGMISSVTIYFSTVPSIGNPSIRIYLLINNNDTCNTYRVVDEQLLPSHRIQQDQKGAQTIVLNEPLICEQGQYVALAFGMSSGSPASVKNRNEHSVNLMDFSSAQKKNEAIRFNNYPNRGVAFSYRVQPISRGRIPSSTTPENEPMIGIDTRSKKSSQSQLKTRHTFEERDDILQESGIAGDHWQMIIGEIRKEEMRLAEEQNDSEDQQTRIN